jgi:hypothetical protein
MSCFCGNPLPITGAECDMKNIMALRLFQEAEEFGCAMKLNMQSV